MGAPSTRATSFDNEAPMRPVSRSKKSLQDFLIGRSQYDGMDVWDTDNRRTDRKGYRCRWNLGRKRH